jgi:glutamine amidotransferase-like uncharacterized protein
MKNYFRLLNLLNLLNLLISLLILNPAMANASAKPLALVWDGPGACLGCVYGAVRVAMRAGFQVKLVGPSLKDFSIFNDAKLWVQPGGKSQTAALSMGPAIVHQVAEFVAAGGGYVGFCAGAFLSTGKIGESEVDGYGLVPGGTELLIQTGNDHAMLKVSTSKYGDRWMYYAGGPFFKVTEEQLAAVQGEVIARYPDGSIAGVHAHYGLGKVAVVGFHPEAGFFWKIEHGKTDPDGSDVFFAVDMAKYATSP